MLEAGLGTFVEKPVDGSQTFTFFGSEPPFCLDGEIEHQSDDLAGIDDQRQMIDVQRTGKGKGLLSGHVCSRLR